jgi:hypothetical protein
MQSLKAKVLVIDDMLRVGCRVFKPTKLQGGKDRKHFRRENNNDQTAT